MLTIATLLKDAKQRLSNSDSPDIDAELLLMQVLNVTRVFLHTWPEKLVAAEQVSQYLGLLARREAGEPIAYILGYKEFWTLKLNVTPDVLIPRPETELLLEVILQRFAAQPLKLADIGTGSGAIALALASERPAWEIWGCDKHLAALNVATANAIELGINNVTWLQSDWCEKLPTHNFNIIVSNPPYIADTDPHLHCGDVRFEPKTALVSAEKGMDDLQKIISQARQHLLPNGFLILEHGYNQAPAVEKSLISAGFCNVELFKDHAGHPRVTSAYWKY